MAIETTPLGYQIPESATELVKRGAKVIGDNARKNQEHIAAMQQAQAAALEQAAEDRARLDVLADAAQEIAHFDGGGPDTIFAPVQLIDGGTV